MKPAILAGRLSPLLPALQCPRCGGAFSLTDQSLICENGHCYDLSRRGYVNLAPSHRQSGDKYDETLFESRGRVFAEGFYAPVRDALCAALADRSGPFTLVDAGCGEGYYARAVQARFPEAQVIGLDLNRDAVALAARSAERGAWFVADLKRLPVQNAAADVVLNVFSPADYGEFRRVLTPDGELLKVVPGPDYLREVRSAVAGYLRGGAYDNASVLAHLRAHAEVISETPVRSVAPLSPADSHDFLRMTPMTFSVPAEALEKIVLEKITIDVRVLRCRMR